MSPFAPTIDQKPLRRSLSILDSVQIARPCPADWSAMRPVAGAAFERVRHCEECRLRVYNLSAMKRLEAEALIRASEGRMCVRLYRREDGTVLTADCSYFRRIADRSAQSARRLTWLAACGIAAVLGSAVWAGALLRETSSASNRTTVMQDGLDRLAQIPPIGRLMGWAQPPTAQGIVAAPMLGKRAVAGAMSMPMGIMMGDTQQGDAAPIGPAPATPPQQWLVFNPTDRAPL